VHNAHRPGIRVYIVAYPLCAVFVYLYTGRHTLTNTSH